MLNQNAAASGTEANRHCVVVLIICKGLIVLSGSSDMLVAVHKLCSSIRHAGPWSEVHLIMVNSYQKSFIFVSATTATRKHLAFFSRHFKLNIPSFKTCLKVALRHSFQFSCAPSSWQATCHWSIWNMKLCTFLLNEILKDLPLRWDSNWRNLAAMHRSVGECQKQGMGEWWVLVLIPCSIREQSRV